MGNFGTLINPAHYVEIADPANPGQVKRPEAGLTLLARDHLVGSALPDITTTTNGYWGANFPGVKLIDVSGDGGVTWVGPLQSDNAIEEGSQAGTNASLALAQANTAVDTAQQALTTAQTGPAATWDNIAGKPLTFPPATHTHTSGQLSDASPVGKAVLTAADAQAARVAIGAGTGNGTSNLTLGTTATTAAPGNHAHAASAIGFTPTGSVTATNVQDAIVQASQSGGSGGSGTSGLLIVKFAAGAYPNVAVPSGTIVRHFYGPVQPTVASVAGVLDMYFRADLT